MPTNPKADQTVEIVGAAGQADYKVQVVGDQVVDLTGATPGDVLVVQADGSLAPQAAVAGGAVDSVTAASAKIVVAGTPTNPTVDVGTGIPAASITGLGTMATQAASAVAISGGTVAGITDLAVADGGTGSSTAADARTALGLGTAATSASTAFDAAGAAAAAATASQPLAGHTSNSVPAASGSTSLADLAMGASTILARLAAGNIVAATPAQLKTLLAIAESDVASLTADLALLAPLASPTFTGVASAPSVSASGKTGATNQATILAGGTASAAPSTGAHVVGELVADALGRLWYCTVAGTPGTWVLAGPPGLIALTTYRPASNTDINVTSTSQSLADVDATNLTVTFTAPPSGRVIVVLESHQSTASAASMQWGLRDGSGLIAGTPNQVAFAASANVATHRARMSIVVSGLTPGTSYTYRWAAMTTSGTSVVQVGASANNPYGSALMEVWAA